MSYIIPITINNRRVHYLNTAEIKQDEEPFIVSMDKNENNLFYFDRTMEAKVIHEHGRQDIPLHSGVVSFALEQKEKVLTIRICKDASLRKKHKNAHDSSENGGYSHWDSEYNAADQQQASAAPVKIGEEINNVQLSWKEEGGRLIVYVTYKETQRASLAAFDLHCNVELEENNCKYVCGFLLQVVPPLQLLVGALDFGSEASQLLQQRKIESGGMLKNESMSVNILEQLIPHMDWGQKEKYIQHEPDTEFYKSIFYIRKKINGIEYDKNKFFLPDENNNLHVVLLRDKELSIINDYVQLPNLKLIRRYPELLANAGIMLEYSGNFKRISTEDIIRKCYGSVLKKIISAWLTPELICHQFKQYVRLTLLVPNIYNEADVRHTLQTLHEIFRTLKENKDIKDKLAGWEVQTVSESDAAFLGFYRKKALPIPPENKYYLIIDCGKGTTDFSVIKMGKTATDPLLPVYRNGIAGAGNLISYSFFQAIIKYIADISDDAQKSSEFVKKLIGRGTASDLLRRVAGQVDTLKHKYSNRTNEREINDKWNGIIGGSYTFANLTEKGEVGQLENLLRLVLAQNIRNVPDEYHLVLNGCRILTDAIISSIDLVAKALDKKRMSCAGVFLTGRGFLFTELTEMLTKDLGKLLKIEKEKIKTPDLGEYKSIALEGILNSPFLLQPQIIGWPVQVEHIELETEIENAEESITYTEILFRQIDKLVHVFRTKVGEISNTNALNTLRGTFDSHRLLIGNDLWWPEDPIFRQPVKGKHYDLIFNPMGRTNGFAIRKLSSARHFEEMQELGDPHPLNRGIEKFIKPSLFPMEFDIDEFAVLLNA